MATKKDSKKIPKKASKKSPKSTEKPVWLRDEIWDDTPDIDGIKALDNDPNWLSLKKLLDAKQKKHETSKKELLKDNSSKST